MADHSSRLRGLFIGRARAGGSGRHLRPERPVRPERPQRPERPERPQRPQKPGKRNG